MGGAGFILGGLSRATYNYVGIRWTVFYFVSLRVWNTVLLVCGTPSQ